MRRIGVDGRAARRASTPRTSSSTIIRQLGVKGGVGYAYEYARRRRRPHDDGRAHDDLQHVDRRRRARRLREPRRDDVRRTCEGRPFAPPGDGVRHGAPRGGGRSRPTPTPPTTTTWRSTADALEPMVTWGINPGQSVGVGERVPSPADVPADERAAVADALELHGLRGGQPIAGTKIDVAFIGSCTNGRLSDLREAARDRAGPARRARTCRALVVPGSQSVRERRRAGRAATRSSARPASSGAAPAARCAWR